MLALGALEVTLRVRAHFENTGLFRPDFNVEVPSNGLVALGNIIRPAANQRIVYELKPDLSVLYRGRRKSDPATTVTTNSLGFRCREIDPVKPPNTIRIVGIGDSYMFGKGVEDDETFMSVMEGILQKRFANAQVDVVNSAVPGYNTVMEVETLKDKGLVFAPDVVIIEFVGNDLSLPSFVRKPTNPLSLRRCFLWSFVRQRLANVDRKAVSKNPPDNGLLKVPMGDDSEWGLAVDPADVPEGYRDLVGWDAFSNAMKELRDLSIQHHFTVVWLTQGAFPTKNSVKAEAIAKGLGFDIVAMGARFRAHLESQGVDSYRGSDLSVSDIDPHPSALAHAMTAEVVAREISRFISRKVESHDTDRPASAEDGQPVR